MLVQEALSESGVPHDLHLAQDGMALLDHLKRAGTDANAQTPPCPELILLDEPTAGMTTEETRDAVKLIERVTVGKTLIIIEHDMDVVFSISDRVSVLYYGKILATGTAEEIKENQEVKKAYLGSKK